MSSVQTALASTTISGYVNTSAQWSMGTGNGNIPGFAYNANKQDGFNLDVVKLSIERPLDEGQWSAGYKADLLFGPDANGLNTVSAAGQGTSDFAIKQAYVALRAPVGTGLDVKLGVFDTIVGYETFDAGSNPNYTRSYGYTLEPTSHTGLLATYQSGEMIGVSAGIANTYGPHINEKAWNPGNGAVARAESYKTYLTSIAFTAPKDWGFLAGSTLYSGLIVGLNTGYGSGRDNHYYVGGAITTPVKGLKVGAAYDYVSIDDSGAGGTGTAYAWAGSVYASFAPEGQKFSFHVRGEYAAQNTTSLNPAGPANYSITSVTAGNQNLVFPTKVFAMTGTIQYDLWKNVLSRLEIRWDHAADNRDYYGGPTPGTAISAANDQFLKQNSFLVAANLIYKF